MKCVIHLLVIAAVVFCAVAHAAALRRPPVPHRVIGGAKDGEGSDSSQVADYYVLCVQKCTDGSPWTIHGLWPQYNATSWPSDCNPEAHFNWDELASIKGELYTYWPNCDSGTESDFLSHEWIKHGTCSQWGELDYFTNALSVFRQGQWEPYCTNGGKECKVHVTFS